STPLPSSISHNASSASGSAAIWDSTNAVTINRGSWRYPSLHNRHIDRSAGGSGAIASSTRSLGEDVICLALLLGDVEPLCLQIEHRPISSAECYQLVVCAELDDPAVLQNAYTVGVADSGEAMRNQDRGAMPCGGEQAIEDLRFPAH